MSGEENYNWTSVWVLSSIHLAQSIEDKAVPKSYKKMIYPEQLSKYKNLYQIIFTGDYINHAIFNDDELLTEIDRLLEGGFIKEIDGYLQTNDKLMNLFKGATNEKNSVSLDTALDIFANILQTKVPWD